MKARVSKSLLLICIAGAPTAVAQPGGRIDLERMRPAGLRIDSYSYMTPPHSEYYFHHIDELGFRLSWVRRSGAAFALKEGKAPALDSVGIDAYFTQNRVAGLLVLRGDTVLLERYGFGADRDSRFVSQSVGKSVVSILVGAALARGKIASVDDQVIKYLPELAESG